ncbi:MAG: hypothetical protein N2038_11950 [Geminicoccaceae bacterium]|nr:hypothetical protein [Geminicoccaceae bacterium]MCS7267315.1 hypothetical protein [Geminicoccaceae bacterium]MCX7630949.1 hypothetical protein [Geminicoccaceae bacterium]MDW8125080.1 hypothetical protein [Geminicoccaceae bacterium]MDW8340632.1 hypothetical protein [Geminicoccaceae bacterium]
MKAAARLLALALLASVCTAGDGRAETASLTELLFAPGFLAAIERPMVLRYRYELGGKAMDRPYRSSAKLEIREIAADGSKRVWLDMFDGPNRRRTGPIPAVDQNPLLLAFLQRDTVTMANLTGGAQGYFQQQIRRAFDRPVTVEAGTVVWQGRTLEARTIRLKPFANDPAIGRFPQFRDKEYAFTVVPEVPGGLWQVRVRVLDSAGSAFLEETLTLDAVE